MNKLFGTTRVGVEFKNFGTGAAARTVAILRNQIPQGRLGIEESAFLLGKSAAILGERGVLPSGARVELLKTMPSIKESVEFIGDSEKKPWGEGMFDAFIFPIQNRLLAERIIREGRGVVTFQGRQQEIPVEADGIMLHSLGMAPEPEQMSFQLIGDPVVNPDNNQVSILVGGFLSQDKWFSTLEILQHIQLADGVSNRTVFFRNAGDFPVPVSGTIHGYNLFPAGQPREGVLLDFSADRYLRTVTPPFVDGETLLPVFDEDGPFEEVAKNPALARFIGKDMAGKNLGETYLDHCFTRLWPPTGKDWKYSARLFYPACQWGVEVFTPSDLIRAQQIYSPKADRAAYRTAVFEFAPCVTDPLNPQWAKFPVARGNLFTPSGMRILSPSHGPESMMRLFFGRRMIDRLE